MTLTEFLAARLDDKELAARNAGAERWDFTGVNCEVRVREPDGDLGRIIAYCRHGNPVQDDLALAIHIAEHDPARALREVEAKRAIVDRHSPHQPAFGDLACDWCSEDVDDRPQIAKERWPCPDIRSLAAIWSDHPDYDPAWA